MTITVEQVNDVVIRLHNQGAYHRKRGFCLKDVPDSVTSNHMIEEAVELQAELLHGRFHTQIEEAANLLAVFLHALYAAGVPLGHVTARAIDQLDAGFTENPDEVDTKTPGYTRRSRENYGVEDDV